MKIDLTIETDVLIIGSGGAGLRCAIELHDQKAKNILVVGKCKKRDAHTKLARGGINAALGNMDPKDNWKVHMADTIRDGSGINNPKAVELVCKHAPEAIKELEKWGTRFHKEKDGRITQRFFGAAKYRRACFVGDQTGKAILNTLVKQVEKRKIPFKSEVYIFELLKNKEEIIGALGIDLKKGKVIQFLSKVTVLATGGHSRVYRRSSSRFWENNGDGIGLAYKVGASFMDMEMFQFHPTGMVHPKNVIGMLVTEAVRGEGGILTNKKGERFMGKVDPDRLELSARDIVAKAIHTEIQAGRGTKKGGVYLDISHKPKSYLLKRLPRMHEQFKTYAKIDISKTKMEVAPTAHYSMGGIKINHQTGETGVKNLYAIGEVTAGVHGGNRLGGNSLAEIMVFGKLTGKHIAKELKNKAKDQKRHSGLDPESIPMITQLTQNKLGKNPIKIKEKIQEIMWKQVGVIRNEKEMKKAFKKIRSLKKVKLRTGKELRMNEKLIAALDIQSMLPTCEMIIESTIRRKESRAAHNRSDYPKTSKAWEKNTICIPSKTGFKIQNQATPPLPADIKRRVQSKVGVKKLSE